jgi:hypothetical protein
MLKERAHIFNMMNRDSTYGATSGLILRRIRGKGRGWAFTPSDFADAGDPRSVGMVLSRLVKHEKIRRVQRGVYEVTHEHPLIGTVGAGADAVMAAIARRDALKLLPSKAAAANVLHLSTQVPAVTTYGVTGRSRTISVGGKSSVKLKRRSPKSVALAGRFSGWLAEALRSFGRGKVSAVDLQKLKRQVPREARKQLMDDLRYVPAWMRPIFKEVAKND